MLLEKLILSEMPDGLNDLEKARYIYLILGRYLSFSTKYQNTDYKEFYKMHEDNFDIKKFDKNQIVCSEWANLYSYFLTKCNINNAIIKKNHHFVKFICDDTVYIADGTRGQYTDLSRIRYGDKTKCFGIAQCQNLNLEDYTIIEDKNFEYLLELLDRKFPFYYDECIRLKKLKAQLNSYKQQNIDLQEKLDLYFKLIGQLKSGYYESKNFVRDLEQEMFIPQELEKIHGTELLRTNEDKEVDILQCIYITTDNQQSIYYILSPNLPVRKVDVEKIKQIADIGYTIYTRTLPGVVFSKEFIPGEISKKRFSLNKKSYTMLEYDEEQYKPLKVI